jgi:hypothetical protein
MVLETPLNVSLLHARYYAHSLDPRRRRWSECAADSEGGMHDQSCVLLVPGICVGQMVHGQNGRYDRQGLR